MHLVGFIIRTEPVPSWSCSQAVSTPVWHVPLLCVEWRTPDDGQRNCPKHGELYSKNKFQKLVHLVGIIIKILLIRNWLLLGCSISRFLSLSLSLLSLDHYAPRLIRKAILGSDLSQFLQNTIYLYERWRHATGLGPRTPSWSTRFSSPIV